MVLDDYISSSSRSARRSAPTVKTTLAELNHWIATASPGEVMEYFRGHLAADRVVAGSRLGREARDELDRVADAAMALAEAGRVHLVQRRQGDSDYSYLAFARSHRSAGHRP